MTSQWKPFILMQIQSNPLIITDSLLCPRGKKALTFSLNSTLLIGTPYELSLAPSASVLRGFYCNTHLHKIGFVLTLVLKVRFFGTRKWPISVPWGHRTGLRSSRRNAELSDSKFYRAQQYPSIPINFAPLVSSDRRFLERDRSPRLFRC